MGIFDRLRNAADRIEASAADVLAKAAPWAAPLPTAYLVGRATMVHLAWPEPVAVIAAITIESLGLATTATALELREYNASKRKSDPRAPFALAVVLVAVYFIVAVGLTVVLDILPALATYAPGVFPVLSLCGVTVLALRSDHRRRVAAVAAERAERRARRSGARSGVRSSERSDKRSDGRSELYTPERPAAYSLDNLDAANAARRVRREEAIDGLLDAYRDNPHLSYAAAGRLVGRSKSWTAQALADLERGGRVRRNGNGVEVLDG